MFVLCNYSDFNLIQVHEQKQTGISNLKAESQKLKKPVSAVSFWLYIHRVFASHLKHFHKTSYILTSLQVLVWQSDTVMMLSRHNLHNML